MQPRLQCNRGYDTVSTVPETRGEWVQLAYRLPREPSTPRIAVWRRLRRLGAVQVVDGLVALPRDSRTQEQLEWLADEIVEANGDATIWIATPAPPRTSERSPSACPTRSPRNTWR